MTLKESVEKAMADAFAECPLESVIQTAVRIAVGLVEKEQYSSGLVLHDMNQRVQEAEKRAEAAEKDFDEAAEELKRIWYLYEAQADRVDMVEKERAFVHNERMTLIQQVEALIQERDEARKALAEAKSRIANEQAARRLAQEHGVGDRARIEELEAALAEVKSKWGHVMNCECEKHRNKIDGLCARDGCCAPQEKA